jgi:hypothetical protein
MARADPSPHSLARRQTARRAPAAPKYGSERVVFAPAALIDLLSVHVAEHRPGDDSGRWLFGDGAPAGPGGHNRADVAQSLR